jgi:hypothetical protein
MDETSLTEDVTRDDETEIGRLEAEIAVKRERVTASLGELRERVQRATSWRHWAAQPRVWIGAGVCLALIVGLGTRRRRRLGE